MLDSRPAPSSFPSLWTDLTGTSRPADYSFVATTVDLNSEIHASMHALPNVMLTMPPGDWFAPDVGIYANPDQAEDDWERGGYLEITFPDDRERLELGTGIEIRGDDERDPLNTPKHSLRLSFKSEYGPTILAGDLFAGLTVDKFDRLELNGGFGDSWVDREQTSQSQGVLIREQWVRETHRSMGQPIAHGEMVHLHLNGVYWGVYELRERLDAGYAESHFGGSKSDYDVVDLAFVADNEVANQDVTNRFDLDNDGRVDEPDFEIVRSRWVASSRPLNILDLRADFDGDQVTASDDIALLRSAIASSDTDIMFDLTQDGRVDLEDLDYLFENILVELPGDANRDRTVDANDFELLREQLWTPNATWETGDFNGDGTTDAADFNIWLDHRFVDDRSNNLQARTPRSPLSDARQLRGPWRAAKIARRTV